jgi:hypothetical protein
MALPNQAPLSEVLKEARQRWTQTRRVAESIRDRSAAGPITGATVLGLMDNLRADLYYFQTVAATPGIGVYAQSQYEGAYDIGPDFTAFMAALTSTIDWIIAAAPKTAADGNGHEWLVVQRLDPTGARIERTFSTVETAGLRTVLDTLIATVTG